MTSTLNACIIPNSCPTQNRKRSVCERVCTRCHNKCDDVTSGKQEAGCRKLKPDSRDTSRGERPQQLQGRSRDITEPWWWWFNIFAVLQCSNDGELLNSTHRLLTASSPGIVTRQQQDSLCKYWWSFRRESTTWWRIVSFAEWEGQLWSVTGKMIWYVFIVAWADSLVTDAVGASSGWFAIRNSQPSCNETEKEWERSPTHPTQVNSLIWWKIKLYMLAKRDNSELKFCDCQV